MIPYDEIENSPYVVWLNFGMEGWQPRICLNWNDVLSELRNANAAWIITKPVKINEPFEKVNNLR